MADEIKVDETKTEETKTPPEDAPKYNDKQVNDLLAAKVGKEASKEVQKILEAAGIKDTAELAELVKGKKPAGEDDKTAAELAEVKKLTGELTARADKNEAVALAMKAGVLDEARLERVVKLAMSPAYEGSIAERIAKVTAEFPEVVNTQGATFGKPVKSDSQDATESMLNAARAAAGLSAPAAKK